MTTVHLYSGWTCRYLRVSEQPGKLEESLKLIRATKTRWTGNWFEKVAVIDHGSYRRCGVSVH